MPNLYTAFYHERIPDPFSLPSVLRNIPTLKSISIGGYNIMVDGDIDISHLSISALQDQAFSNIDATTIELPHTLSALSSETFSGCNWLETVIIPVPLSEILRNAFGVVHLFDHSF